jgi:hypothetical protein
LPEPTSPTDETKPPATGLALASPLTLLLEEERHGDRQAEHALFLSFTTDLGFFEAVGLGPAQACGARVTVVGDAAMATADPRAVRRAGRSYLPGYAACGGAFHPKLVAIVGPQRATVAIGSGNTTLPGWQTNAELWTVLRGDRERVPAAFTDVSGWLRYLPDAVRFSSGVPETLTSVAEALQRLCDHAGQVSGADSTTLVSSVDGAILSQLPAGPVEELAVCAPFHDPGAVALRSLVTRLQPRRVIVSYQTDLTQLDGPALAELAAELDAEIRLDGEVRYRHGKLIEWVIDGHRYALTGSPNLSSAALLKGVNQGGNCELGIITPLSSSLLPAGTAVSTATVGSARFSVHGRDEAVPLLLGATRIEQGLHVMLARPGRVAGHVELSPAAAPPEAWERVGNVPAGEAEVTVTVPAPGGSRLRLAIVVDDLPRYSNVVFVVDPVSVLRRPGITAEHIPTTRPDDLFDDARLAERFLSDLTALAATLTRPPGASTVAAENRSASITADVDTADRWERYLDECAGRIGHPLLRFALGLPALPQGHEPAYEALLPVSWDERFTDDSEAGLDDDNVEDETELVADQAASSVLPDLLRSSPTMRRRYRRWASRLTQAAPQFGAPERMLVTRLLLWTAAAGAWDHDDHSWLDLLADAVRELGSANVAAPIEPQVASLAAVALAVLRAHAPRNASTRETLAFARAAKAVDYLLPAADGPYIAEYSKLLARAFGPATTPEAVQILAAEIVQADPVADAVWALAELGHDAHRHGDRLLHITGNYSNPLPVALQAIGAAQDAALVGAWATAKSGGWILAIWRRPDLITIDARQPTRLWRHYRLDGLVSPASLAAQRSLEGARSVHHGPFMHPFPEAVTALQHLGLEPSACQPPTACA